jgi:uncharacterized protein (TIGR03435 family)
MIQRTALNCMLMKAFLLAASASVCTASLHAQAMPPMPMATDGKEANPAARVPEFDVSSVKQNKSEQGMMRVMYTPSGFSSVNFTLKNMISQAYGIKPDMISGGEGWVETTGFDVDAKVSPEDVDALKKLTGKQRGSMLKTLLADRFKLKVHMETKVLPIYVLMVGKGGPKLTESAPVPPPDPDAPKPDPGKMDFTKMSKRPGSMRMGPGELTAFGIGMDALATNLSNSVHRQVEDKTGLKGKYDLTLKFAPEDGSPASTDTSLPSVFTALEEQLGLHLQASKGDVETLVIDHAEMPLAD